MMPRDITMHDLVQAMRTFRLKGVKKILLHPDNFDKLCKYFHVLHPSFRLTIAGLRVEANGLAPVDGWIDVLDSGYVVHRPKNNR